MRHNRHNNETSNQTVVFRLIQYTLILLTLMMSETNLASESIELNGEWRFIQGPRTLAELANADSASWVNLDFTNPANAHGKLSDSFHGWYHLRLSQEQLSQFDRPALFLGTVLEADKTYFNGELIGHEGEFGSAWSNVAAYNKQRIYEIPTSDIQTSNDLLIQIRTWYTFGGMQDGAPRLGELSELRVSASDKELKIVIFEALIISSMWLSTFVALWALAYTQTRSAESYYLFITMLILTFTVTADSLSAYLFGVRNSFVQTMTFAVQFLLVIPIRRYYQELKLSPTNRVERYLGSATVATACLSVAGVIELLPFSITIVSTLAWVMCVLAILALIIFYTAKAASENTPGAKLHLSGLLILIICFIWYSFSFQINGYMRVDFLGIGVFGLFIMLGYLERNRSLYSRHRELTATITTLYNSEQQRIASDLHDGFGHHLAAMSLHLSLLRDTNDDKYLDLAESALSKSQKQIRHLLNGLSPVAIDSLGLKASIENEVADMIQTSNLDIKLNLQQTNLSDNKKLNLFRIFQEAFTNALKHSECRSIKITLKRRRQTVLLEIRDDGNGQAHEKQIESASGMGLLTIKERADVMSAQLKVVSTPGHGTRIQVSVPI